MDQLAVLAKETNFGLLDWFIVAGYMSISIGIGLLASRFVANMGDYVAAGRGVRTALGIATLTGTELGLVTVMYSAQKGFTGGFAAFHIGLAAGVVTFFVGLTGFIVAGLRREEVLTIPEFFGKRYGPRTRVLSGIILSFGGILNMGMFLKAGSKFVVGVTGMPEAHVPIVMLVMLSLVLFYTILGGMVSVVLADYVQFVVLSFGLLLATGIAIGKLGWGNIFSTVIEYQGEAGFNPLKAESSFGWEYVVWMVFLGLASCALWPTSVARALAAQSERVVKRQFMIASFSYAIRNIVPYFWGICAFVLVIKMPDLTRAFFPAGYPAPAVMPEGMKALDSLYAMPILMGRILPGGLIGIITAAMIAAFMSTHDSYLLCWSSVLTHDVVAPLSGNRLSQHGRITVTRLFIFLIGAVIFTVSMWFPLQEDLWDYMAVTGAIYTAGAFALLVGGLYWKRASSTGAVLALITSSAAVLGLGQVQHLVFGKMCGMSEETLARFTSARVGLAVVVTTLVVMVAGSLLFPDKASAVKGEAA